MSDFASAAMLRVLAQGLRELGLDPGTAAPPTGDARVSLAAKRAVVACLPALGRGLHRLAHEPTHQALASARSARDLFDRWQRLERYIHSRHRCRVASVDAGGARIRHESIEPRSRPSPAEDLVVAGVLAALLEAIGMHEVRAWVGDAAAYPAADERDMQRAAAQGSTSSWTFAWSGAAKRPALPDPAPADARLGCDPAWPPAARDVYLRLIADPTRPWPLPALAQEIGTPWRSLQRRLAASGLSYSILRAEARLRTGAWRLLYTADPIAEVGFLSGFSDQPHFTREMRRRVGMPPAAYREAFGQGVG
ncbi:AraC family transcriptional regulator [Piscinibacter sakaiensis]|uniref:helix-turn-helix transcriptional regulator n=1 Tax=Piscinibacter sakaiensis TaxID=1547922 RepID=UPI00372A84F0